jgi:hypothetical protein
MNRFWQRLFDALALLSLALGIMTVVLWIMCATGLHAIGWLHDGTRWTVFGGAGTRFGSDSDWGIMLVPNWPYHDLYLDWEGPGFEFPFTTPILLFAILPILRLRQRLPAKRILVCAALAHFLWFVIVWIPISNTDNPLVQLAGIFSIALPVIVIWLTIRRWRGPRQIVLATD